MFGIVIAAVTGGLLGANGYTWEQGVFWAVLIPACIVGTYIDITRRRKA